MGLEWFLACPELPDVPDQDECPTDYDYDGTGDCP